MRILQKRGIHFLQSLFRLLGEVRNRGGNLLRSDWKTTRESDLYSTPTNLRRLRRAYCAKCFNNKRRSLATSVLKILDEPAIVDL